LLLSFCFPFFAPLVGSTVCKKDIFKKKGKRKLIIKKIPRVAIPEGQENNKQKQPLGVLFVSVHLFLFGVAFFCKGTRGTRNVGDKKLSLLCLTDRKE